MLPYDVPQVPVNPFDIIFLPSMYLALTVVVNKIRARGTEYWNIGAVVETWA